MIGIWIESGVSPGAAHWQLTMAIYLVIYFALFLVMLRFGLVATIAAVFYVNTIGGITLGLDWTAWYAPYGLASSLLLLALTVVAFWRSLGARTIFGSEVAP